MRTKCSGLMIIGLLLASTICGCHSKTSDRAELFKHPGQQWLSWSSSERENFVYGYILGYTFGVSEACRAADGLFEKDQPHVFGYDDVPSTFPSARCRASVAQYLDVKIDSSRVPDFSAYTTVITEFYTKHPEYRDSQIALLMEALVGTKGLTADDMYRKWTTWKSPSPH
jgi:hypothetical protein